MTGQGNLTRRQVCKNLCSASLMPATLASFAKFYCGIDFGSGGSTTVWHKIIPSNVYLRGGRYSGYRQMRNYWRWALGQISAEELVGGRASPKSLSAPKPREKSKREKQEEECRWLWFEEANDFENYAKKGMKND